MKTRYSIMLWLFLCLLLSVASFAQTRQYYEATLNPEGIPPPAITINAISYISYGEIENGKIVLRDLDAGQDGIFTFRFHNIDDTDDVTVRFADEMDSGVYYRFRFNGSMTELAYNDGAANGSIDLPTSTTKNNNILRLERCGGQILWREQSDVLRLSSGNDGGVLVAVVEPSISTTNVQMSVEFEPNATICDKCAVAGGTNLYPGDLMFVGYDNFASDIKTDNPLIDNPNEKDWISIRPQVTLSPGTSFLLTEAVYEKDNMGVERWYAGDGNNNRSAIASQQITYVGATPIDIGDVICFEIMGMGVGDELLATNFYIAGVNRTTDFCVKNVGNTVNPMINIRCSGGNQQTALFLQQGDWKYTDTHGDFCGRTVSGLQYGGSWITTMGNLGSGNTASQIPPDIECIYIQASTEARIEDAKVNVNLSTSNYQQTLEKITNFGNWQVRIDQVDNLDCNDQTTMITALQSSPLSDVHIYPNPFSEMLHVAFDLAEPQTIDFSLVDINGRLVYQSVNTNILAAGHHQLELAPNLPPNRTGLLMLRIITPTGVIVRRVVYRTPFDEGQPATIFGRG